MAYNVAAVLQLHYMVHVMLLSTTNVLYFYIRTFCFELPRYRLLLLLLLLLALVLC